MQQSNFIFGILLVAYVVFVTIKGELGQYLALFKGAGTPAPTNQSGSGSSSGGPLSSLLSQGQGLLSGDGGILNAPGNSLSSPTGTNTSLNSNLGFSDISSEFAF